MRRHASALALAALLGAGASSASPDGLGGPRRALRDTSRLASSEDLPMLLQPLAQPPAPAHSSGLFSVDPAGAGPSAEYQAHVRQAAEAVQASAAPGMPAGHAAGGPLASLLATASTSAAAASTAPLLVPLPLSAAEAAVPVPRARPVISPPVHEDPGLAPRVAPPARQGPAGEGAEQAEAPAADQGPPAAAVAGPAPANVVAASGFAAAVSAPAGTAPGAAAGVVAPALAAPAAEEKGGDDAPGPARAAAVAAPVAAGGGRLMT